MKNAKRAKESNKKSTLAIVVLLILAIVVSVGTIAWLTRISSVTNTFTVGSFETPTTDPTNPENPIEIDGNIYEPSWNEEEEHRLIPGVTFAKDPYVGIGAGSEDATVYVYVENSCSNKVYFTINEGWEAVDGETTAGSQEGTYTSGLFKYTTGLTGATDSDVWTTTPIFSQVVTDETATSDDFTATAGGNPEIKVSSFLHQTKDAEGIPIPTKTIEDAVKVAFEL